MNTWFGKYQYTVMFTDYLYGIWGVEYGWIIPFINIFFWKWKNFILAYIKMTSHFLSIIYYIENIWPGWNCTPQNGYFLASKFAIKVTFSGLVEVANGVYKSLSKADE